MNRFVLAGLFALAMSSYAYADVKDTVQSKTVVISAARVSIPLAQIPRTVDVITQKKLSLMPIRSMSDALMYVPGVDLRQRGPYGIQADVSMRGGSFEQTAVLVDGMRMNDVQTGHHSLNLPIMPEEIERIEVVKGGTTRLYGPGALDGAINIITRRGGEPQLKLQFTGGDFGFIDGRAYATSTTGDVYHRTGVQYMSTPGYQPGTAATLMSAMYSGNVDVNATTAQWQVGFSDRAFDAYGYYVPSPLFPQQWEHTTTWHASGSTTTLLDTATTLTVRGLYRVNTDDFRLKKDTPTFYQNIHTTHTLTGLALLSHVWEIGTTTIGVEGGHDDILSTALGIHDRLRGGLSLEHSYAINNEWLFAAGVSNTMYSDRAPGIGWGADVSYRPTSDGKVFVTVNRSYRVPTYTELYYPGPTYVGSPTLLPETAITGELGSEWMVGNVLLRGALYHRDGQNMIDYAYQGVGLPYKAENITQVTVNGVEIGGTFFGLHLSAVYNHIALTETVNTRYVMDQLKWQGIADYTIDFPLEIRGSFIIRALQRYNSATLNGIGDIRLVRVFGDFRIMAEATNLWNTSYIETGWVSMPPRWFRMSIEWNALLR